MEGTPQRFLLVEDNPGDARFVTRLLEEVRPEAAVVTAESLAAGEAALAEGPVRAVLADLGLPDARGVHAVERLKAAAGDAPILVLSGHETADVAVSALHAGAVDYLTKAGLTVAALERALAHADLRRRHGVLVQRSQLVMQAALDGIVITDSAGSIIEANITFARMTGISPCGMAGRSLAELETRPEVADLGERLARLRDRGFDRFRTRYRPVDGRPVVDVEVSAYHRPGDRGGELVLFVRDLTEHNRMVAELEAARAAAERADAAKSRFLARMSHEVRTPMTAVVGLADLLQADALPPEAAERARVLRRSAGSLLGLLDELLDLSRVEAGGLALEAAPFDPAALVHEVAALFRPQADAAGLTFTAGAGAGVPAGVSGDAGRLRQVLFNLVANAMRFTAEGTVRLGLEAGAPDADGNVPLAFAVHDTGVGLSDEERGRIFAPFAQADTSTARRYGGTGLGLSVARGLVEAMGGTLAVDSTPGRGSTFRFTVALPPAEPPHAGAENDDAFAPAAQPQRLLVVEDTEATRQLLVAALERMGHTVAEAADGATAVRTIAADPEGWDAVLVDLHMPDMDGFAVAGELIAAAGEAGPRRIALSADVLPETRRAAQEAGFHAFLGKPVAWPELRRTLAAGAAGDSGRPAVDESILAELEGAVGPGRLAALTGRAAADLRHYAAAVEAGARAGDVNATRAAAHALKGVARQYGAMPLSEAAATAEGTPPERVDVAALGRAAETAARALEAAGGA